MKNILENNTVIITGASKKIGKAIVKKLSLEEANLVLLDKGGRRVYGEKVNKEIKMYFVNTRRAFFKKVFFLSSNFLFGVKIFAKTFQKEKITIIYLTRTNNTKVVAQMLHNQIGGDLIELQTKIPYPQNYKKIVEQVRNENDKDFLPEIVDIKEFDKYEKIFLGFPTWGMQLPPPMKSLLDKYDFSNKTIIPFNTNAGYGIGDSFETIKRMAPTANILDGFSVKGAIERDGIYFVMKGDYKDKVNTKLISWINNIKNR